MSQLPDDIKKILLTAAKISSAKGEINDSLELFKSAKIDIQQTDYDNWNGGQYGYTLHLQLPINVYSRIEDDLEKIEKDMENRLRSITRKYDNEYISKIIISPALIDSQNIDDTQTGNSLEPEIIKFWEVGYLRLFISHTSANKLIAAHLQKQLLKYGITSFVAHEDIEPSKEWMTEIELALSTMDGLIALVTTDFNSSKWCDQEVGIAIGRKIFVLPIRYKTDPYGFIGKYQAVTFTEIDKVTETIVDILVGNDKTKFKMANAIVSIFCKSDSFVDAKNNLSLVEKVGNLLTDEMKEKILKACSANPQIIGSWGVVDKAKKIITKS